MGIFAANENNNDDIFAVKVNRHTQAPARTHEQTDYTKLNLHSSKGQQTDTWDGWRQQHGAENMGACVHHSVSHVQDYYKKDSRLLDVTIGKDEVVEEHVVGLVVSVEVQLFVQSVDGSLRVFRATCIRMPSFTLFFCFCFS